jgi:2-octaprenylphenol hydroxylase
MTNGLYDIAVVGAGMVGATFAVALKESPLSLALLDGGPRPVPPPGDRFDVRVSAISPGTRSILEAGGAWDYLDQERVGPYQAMYVWDASSSGSIEFEAADIGEPWLGYIIENANIQQALLQAIESAANIHSRFDATPAGLEVDAEQSRLLLEGGRILAARLVVGADGARSWVRKALGISTDMRLYGERAYVCEARTDLPHRQTAWQRFLPTGPVAFLPLANGHSSAVWTCDAELAAELADLDEASFGRRLEAAFDRKLGAVEVVSAVQSFDLSRRQAVRYVGDRGALIGDAAHVVHPLAGQGANLGFSDAWSLARVVREAQAGGRDIGRSYVLRRYERWRRSENFSTMRMLDALHGLFSTDSAAVRVVRGLGLNMVDSQDWLKHFLARQAMGPESGDAHLR